MERHCSDHLKPSQQGLLTYRIIEFYIMYEGGDAKMKMVKILIQIPEVMKGKLHALRSRGVTASGLIRHLLEEHFSQVAKGGQKGR